MIDLFQALILGLVQGATEFLPVSSSAHLVIFQHILKLDMNAGPIVAFDVCLHVGTLFAVLFALKDETIMILKGLFSKKAAPVELPGGFTQSQGSRAIWLIGLGTLPAVVLGFAFKDFFEELFTKLLPVGVALLVTGCILFATRFVKRNDTLLKDMKWWHAVAVGLAQALAIIPGISRSGSTISMGLFTRLDRQLAAKFSFLLSVIAIGGAAVLEYKNLSYISADNLGAIIVGTLAAFIVGYLCVRLMLAIMRNARFSWFAVYCWIVGIAVIIWSQLTG